ncbi:MAG: hypothetical protein HGA45_26460 [Chloroflexales bacterium]|nr:hypothetical protein [Chloroflexales bacterium]
MRDISRRLSDEEPPAPADPSWVFTMLSEGMYFPPPDPSADPFEESTDQSGHLLVALMVLALLVALLLVNQLV